jgi:ribosomal protein L32
VRRLSTARIRKRRDDSDARSAPPLSVCDFCGSARSPAERNRVVWDCGIDSDLLLADLCGRCAADADRLLALYGGRGRNALTLTRETRAALPVRAARARTLGRVLVYLLAGLASFILVTLISSLR